MNTLERIQAEAQKQYDHELNAIYDIRDAIEDRRKKDWIEFHHDTKEASVLRELGEREISKHQAVIASLNTIFGDDLDQHVRLEREFTKPAETK